MKKEHEKEIEKLKTNAREDRRKAFEAARSGDYGGMLYITFEEYEKSLEEK